MQNSETGEVLNLSLLQTFCVKMATWDHFGDIASVAQLTGLDAVRLIGLIVKSASTARMHKKNCKQFAQHLRLIGNLLEQLQISELKKYSATREPLEQLEDALRRSYILVNSCRDRSYLYLLAMGWNIVYQFRKAQTEIDRYLRLVPLITLVDNARVREKLEVIEYDQRDYTLDYADRKVQDVIMKADPSPKDSTVLKKSLSRSYPDMPFNEALRTESQKLRLELQRSQANLDVGQSEIIQHLIEVAEVAALNAEPEKNLPKPDAYSDTKTVSENVSTEKKSKKSNAQKISMNTYTVTPDHNHCSIKAYNQSQEWHSDLLGCCAEPYLCFSTLVWPCGTFSKIATVATNRHMTSAEACNELSAYSLVLSCCCYTCCIRQKLRKTLNIEGGSFDDFLSHLMCCWCALVQELREVNMRGIEVVPQTSWKMTPPPSQRMDA